jgi:hypothetical protein
MLQLSKSVHNDIVAQSRETKQSDLRTKRTWWDYGDNGEGDGNEGGRSDRLTPS